ncbi:MAG TPA: hypothetical protein VMV86_04105, partial [Methanosarcinales archaeon]|nr:hypothetical protein [Methanosarcinales archaeon]
MFLPVFGAMLGISAAGRLLGRGGDDNATSSIGSGFMERLRRKAMPAPPPEDPRKKSLEEMLLDTRKRLTEDRARLSGLPNSSYPGRTTTPMSALTQRSRELRSRFAQKPASYSGKIADVLNRETPGLSPEDKRSILSDIETRQGAFGANTLEGRLRNQFLSSYTPEREAKFREKTGGDIRRGLSEFDTQLSDVSRVAAGLDQSRNLQLGKSLQELQAQKKQRREGLIGNLEQFGNQQHAAQNFENQINRNRYRQETDAPYKRIGNLEQFLNSLESEVAGDMHPDLMPSKGKDLQRAIADYENQGNYTGNLTNPLPAELLTSHSMMGRINPKFQDAGYARRKGLRKQLSASPNVSQAALSRTAESLNPLTANLEHDAEARLKKDISRLNNKYIQLGQFGSKQHMDEAQERAREINRATLEQRNRLFKDTFTNQLSAQHQEDIGKMRSMNALGAAGQSEFNDLMGNIRSQNALGATQWKNRQAEDEELYKNYQNDALWNSAFMQEQMRRKGIGQGRNEAYDDIFAGMQARNISLENLANLNTNYSEIERERNTYRDELSSMREAMAAQGTIREEQLAAENNARAQQQAQQQYKAAVEAQRLRDLESYRWGDTLSPAVSRAYKTWG